MIDTGWPKKVSFDVDLSGLDEGSASLLHGIVKGIQPQTCLETGTHKGRSTQAIASALVFNNRGHLWTLDKEDFKVDTSEALSPAERQRVTVNIGESPGCLHDMLNGEENTKGIPVPIDFAYLDGGHDEETLLEELEFVKIYGATKHTIIVDNTLDDGWPGVVKAITRFTKDRQGYDVVTLPTMTGMTIMRRIP